MEIILSGVLVYIVTYLSKKLNLSATVVSMILSLVAGTIYYILTNYYQATYEQMVTFAAGSYAMSQFIYNIVMQIQKKTNSSL